MNKQIKEVLQKLIDNGYEAYIVGGYTRDYYMKIINNDYDITTNATPKEIKEVFKSSVIPNNQYGSVVVYYKNTRFEITTYRVELEYNNNRFPSKYKFTNSLDEDLLRRDFTMNTICMDVSSNIIDKLNGIDDIKNSLIRMVGSPSKKIEEDSLRILRAIRFATIFNFRLESNLEATIKSYGYLLKTLSFYRKKEELDKIFASPNVKYGLKLIKELNLDKYLDLSNIDNVKPINNVFAIWAQLNVLDIYNFNKNEYNQILKISELLNHNILDNNNLYKYGLYCSMVAGEVRGIDKKEITRLYDLLPIKIRKDIAITSKEICKILNIKAGELIGKVYLDLEKNILNNKLNNNSNDIKNYILKKYK